MTTPEDVFELFQTVNNLIPETQVLHSVPPGMPARDALALMRKLGFSQLPVMQGEAVLGLFSYRAFALEAAEFPVGKIENPVDLPVEEFLKHEAPVYAQLKDPFRNLIEVLDDRDSVMVSGAEALIAIVTPMDVLRYLYSVAGAYVLIWEIELALRGLIRVAAPSPEALQVCVQNALTSKYQNRPLPAQLEDMEFDDYLALLRDGRNWRCFESTFGGTRERLRGRLEPIRDLRNAAFHFRRELSVDDHTALVECREWLHRCFRKVRAQAGEAK